MGACEEVDRVLLASTPPQESSWISSMKLTEQEIESNIEGILADLKHKKLLFTILRCRDVKENYFESLI